MACHRCKWLACARIFRHQFFAWDQKFDLWVNQKKTPVQFNLFRINESYMLIWSEGQGIEKTSTLAKRQVNWSHKRWVHQASDKHVQERISQGSKGVKQIKTRDSSENTCVELLLYTRVLAEVPWVRNCDSAEQLAHDTCTCCTGEKNSGVAFKQATRTQTKNIIMNYHQINKKTWVWWLNDLVSCWRIKSKTCNDS